jgi:hypothetical protein
VRRPATARVASVHGGIGPPLAGRSRSPRSPRAAVYAAALSDGIFGVVPVLFTAFFMYGAIRAHAFAVDFHNGEWPAGLRMLHGLSPYFGPHSAAVLSAGSPHPTVTPMVYPALGALLFAGLALLPHTVADATFTCLDMAAVLVALRLLGVRDRRLYGVVFLWPPVVSGWQTANITLLLVLGLAAAWRFRDRPALGGLVLAGLVSVKLILWPLGLWLLATRRYVSVTYALTIGVAINVAAWAVLGFNELPRYLRVLQAFDRAGERRAYSTVSLAAVVVGFGLTSFAGMACLAIGRRGRDRQAFTLCIAVALLATPIIWLHYFALLVVPLALARPRLSAAWLLPLVLFACPPTSPSTRQIVLALCVCAALLLVALDTCGTPTAKLRRAAVAGRDLVLRG